MDVFLSHLDLGPALYGIIMWIGLGIMLAKLLRGSWFSLFIDIVVFTLVFKLHGGTLTGGFAAMICAMISGVTFPFMIRKLAK